MARTRCPSSYDPADNDSARLVKLLGARRMAALQAAFGGKRIWIPKRGGNLRCSICLHRDRCMRIWRVQGLAISRIARRMGVSAKTVYRVLGLRERARRARRAGPAPKPILIRGIK